MSVTVQPVCVGPGRKLRFMGLSREATNGLILIRPEAPDAVTSTRLAFNLRHTLISNQENEP